jgi:CRP-like cAMP-binding protein
VEPSLLFHLPLSNAQEIAGRSLQNQRAVLSVGEYGMDVATRVVETLLIRNSDRRIAATLLRVAPLPDGETPACDIHLTQAQIGEMANADRQVVNRVLKRFEAEGWVHISYGRIRIADAAALRAFVKGG